MTKTLGNTKHIGSQGFSAKGEVKSAPPKRVDAAGEKNLGSVVAGTGLGGKKR